MASAEEARDLLLEEIRRLVESGLLDPQGVLQLAEAYAWLVRPDQSHGPAEARERALTPSTEQELPAPFEGRRPSVGLDDR